MEVTDLDALVPEAKRVKFGGVEYDIPSDMPMEVFLRLNLSAQLKTEDGEPDQIAQVNALKEVIVDLITWEQPEKDKEKIRADVAKTLGNRGVKFTFSLLRTIYGDAEEPDPTEPQDQAQQDAATNGTKNSST